MKCTTFFLIFIFSGLCSYSQSLDENIKVIANNIAYTASKKGKIHLAVADFISSSGKADALTQYITDQTEISLINSGLTELHIMDRKHIKQLLSENHLQSEGLIDERTAKSSVSFIKVDGWIIGEIIPVGNGIIISLKIIDVSTSEIFGATPSELINDKILNEIRSSTVERSDSLDKKCSQENTGDFCFTNSTNIKMSLKIVPNDPENNKYWGAELILDTEQTQCVYNMSVGSYTYLCYYRKNDSRSFSGIMEVIHTRGQVNIEKCKSKTLIIN